MKDNYVDFDAIDLEYNIEPDCKTICGDEVRYNNIIDCAKNTGDDMAKCGEYKQDIVIFYRGNIVAIRRYVPADYNEETYEKFLDVVDPYRPVYAGYEKNPIVLECGYYTDWINIR